MPCRRTPIAGRSGARLMRAAPHGSGRCCWRRRCCPTLRRRRTCGLSPTLANIKRSTRVRLGYREASPPFSFLDQANRPIGYSLELCEAIVEEIGAEVDDADLKIDYVKVTSETRIPAVLDNKIDLECGSTTANAERAQARRLLAADVRRRHQADGAQGGAAVTGITDLKGKTIVVTKGTTNEQAIAAADKKFALGLTIVAADDHEQSYQMLADGKADAFATDDILLYGLIARHKAQDKFKVVGDLPVLRPLRHHVPQGRAAARRRGRAHLPQARHQPRPGAALQEMVRGPPADRRAARCRRSRRSSRRPSRRSTISQGTK